MYPDSGHPNLGIYQVGMGSVVPFSVLMTDALPDLHLTGSGSGGQYFSRFTYEDSSSDQLAFDDADARGVYLRVDNLTDTILADYVSAFGGEVSKDQCRVVRPVAAG